MNQTFLIAFTIVLLVTLAVVLIPRFFPSVNARLGQLAGTAYQQRMLKQIKKKYPLIAERIEGYEMNAGTQDAFQHAMKKLPPQEGMKLQTEFNRLRDNFLIKHPEVQPLFESGQDGRAQAKAFDDLLKLPEPQRQALEKDLIWAWDHLRKTLPKQVGPLEAAFRKKSVEAPQA
jgi:hypothetical protein